MNLTENVTKLDDTSMMEINQTDIINVPVKMEQDGPADTEPPSRTEKALDDALLNKTRFDNYIQPLPVNHISIVNPERPDLIKRRELEIFNLKKETQQKIDLMASKDFRQINAAVIFVAWMLISTIIIYFI